MPTWTYSLKFSLRSLVRETVRNFWGRTFVYPRLAANERSADHLRSYVARRAARIGVPLGGDGVALPRLATTAGLLTKAEVRARAVADALGLLEEAVVNPSTLSSPGLTR